MGLENLYGFGCAVFGPGRCVNTDRGFLLHAYIILNPLLNVKQKDACFSKGGEVLLRHEKKAATRRHTGVLREDGTDWWKAGRSGAHGEG